MFLMKIFFCEFFSSGFFFTFLETKFGSWVLFFFQYGMPERRKYRPPSDAYNFKPRQRSDDVFHAERFFDDHGSGYYTRRRRYRRN